MTKSNSLNFALSALLAGILIPLPGVRGQQAPASSNAKGYVNSIGLKMVRIAPGRFRMGNDAATDPKRFGQSWLLPNGDYDERPTHEVVISQGFHISETEVTLEQFQKYRFDAQDDGRFSPFVSNVTWSEAQAFCDWLSKREAKHYRLPTEAEWEYVARGGGAGPFPGGDIPPLSGAANAFGVKNMNTDVLEWVADWYGPYSWREETDPVGPKDGVARVVRGGGIMGPFHGGPAATVPYYRRSQNRGSVAPEYRSGAIGFRIVEGPALNQPARDAEPVFAEQFVKTAKDMGAVPFRPVTSPWFHVRAILPSPPENMWPDAIAASGMNPGFLGHIHSTGAAACSNGDVLWIGFASSTPDTEYLPNTTWMVSRLRRGSDQWDMPSMFYDFADVNDQSAMLWGEGSTLRFFGGGVGLRNVPFRERVSNDCGATWSRVSFPLVSGDPGGYNPQPINSAFRGADGAIFVASDAVGAESMLWVSRDEGKTWADAGGRTGGRHTTFVTLRNGNILGMGGKNSDIDGYMPYFVSSDGGKSWTKHKSQFPAMSTNQRPTLIRLASGRLFFASDWQDRQGRQPKGVTEHGAFIALSDDDGTTWRVKTLPHTLSHEASTFRDRDPLLWSPYHHDHGTLGYAVATQTPDGLIHLIGSMTQPSQEFEMNEAWILSGSRETTQPATSATGVVQGTRTYANGAPQATWTGKVSADGRYLLDGVETWFYPTRAKQYEVTYKDGVKTGSESYWNPDGKKAWEWTRRPDGTATWLQYWDNGAKKHESHWKDGVCEGPAAAWSPKGNSVGRYVFIKGELKPGAR